MQAICLVIFDIYRLASLFGMISFLIGSHFIILVLIGKARLSLALLLGLLGLLGKLLGLLPIGELLLLRLLGLELLLGKLLGKLLG
jgi:hypothetical protein